MVEEARRFAPAVPGSLTSIKESRVLRDWHDHTVACVTDCAASVGGINTRMRMSHGAMILKAELIISALDPTDLQVA